MINAYFSSAFIDAIKHGETQKVYAMLKEAPALANILVDDNSPLVFTLRDNKISALMLAARLGHNDIIDLLCQFGVDVNFCDEEGQNALLDAVRFGKIKTVDHLVHYYGLDLKHRNIHGFSALMCSLWAMQSDMALFLLEYYAFDLNLEEQSHNAFANTINQIYQLKDYDQNQVIADYNSGMINLFDEGLKAKDLLNETWRRAKVRLKAKLNRMLDNQLQESPSYQDSNFFRNLKNRLNASPTTLVIDEVISEIKTCGLFAHSSKAALRQDLEQIKQLESVDQLLAKAKTLQDFLMEGAFFEAVQYIKSLKVSEIERVIQWNSVSSLLSAPSISPLFIKHLFEFALQHHSVGILTKLLSLRLVNVDEVIATLTEDKDEEYTVFCYLSLTLAKQSDATLIVQNNFEAFEPKIESLSGHYADMAQWLQIHHQMSSFSQIEEASEEKKQQLIEQKVNYVKSVFSRLLQLSDRDHDKIVMLRHFAESVCQKGGGFSGHFSQYKTPFLLLLEMYGEKLFSTDTLDELISSNTYLPLSGAQSILTSVEGNAANSKPVKDLSVKI